MMRFVFLLVPIFLFGQQLEQGVTHSGLRTGQAPFPISEYVELPNPVSTSFANWGYLKKISVGWGSTDVRYAKEKPYFQLNKKQTLKAWKGERVVAQMIVSNVTNSITAEIAFSDLVLASNSSQKIDKKNISASFVRYVMTDGIGKDQKTGCGYRKASDFDSLLVADVIDHRVKSIEIVPYTSRPIWVTINVPAYAKEGKYKGWVALKNDRKIIKKLPIEIQVIGRTLPPPKDWSFHLDLWQNPYAVARYFGLKPWSEQHLKQLKIEMENYAQAGGKSITASIMHQPWGGQTYDYFESMITWIKKIDGSWHFKFDIFDKWVQLMMDLGVDKQINCYSMIPWKLSFQYFDQATNKMQTIRTQPGEPAYQEVWTAMLKQFASHLKDKGWFEKTYISMDERPLEVMQTTLKIIKEADPYFKISFAGDLHHEIEPYLDDLCIPLQTKYPPKTIENRKEKGKITTYYTCCTEIYPNTFTFSPPAESEWLAWYVAKANLDGYLRWALNSWPIEPLLDSRFTAWAAGDTYLVYPQGRTSLRFERLRQGIQFYEKIRILKEEFTQNKNTESLQKIEEALQLFDENTLPQSSASQVTQKAQQIINSL